MKTYTKTVAFLQVCNQNGTEFKLNDRDIADVPYEDVIEKLPLPKIVLGKIQHSTNLTSQLMYCGSPDRDGNIPDF